MKNPKGGGEEGGRSWCSSSAFPPPRPHFQIFPLPSPHLQVSGNKASEWGIPDVYAHKQDRQLQRLRVKGQDAQELGLCPPPLSRRHPPRNILKGSNVVVH